MNVDFALAVGGNAGVAVRFDSSEMGQQLTEIVAYGTAQVGEWLSAPPTP